MLPYSPHMVTLATLISLMLLAAPSIQQALSISGRVLDDRGAPVAALTIELQSQYGTSLYPKVATRTDVDGKYSLDGLGPGTWRIRVYRPDGEGGLTALTDKIELEERSIGIDFEMPTEDKVAPNIQPGIRYFPVPPSERLAGAPVLEGALIDVQSLEPIEGATIEIYRKLDNEKSELVAAVQSDEFGVYRIEDLTPAIYRFSISREGYQDPWDSSVKIDAPMRTKVYMLRVFVGAAKWRGEPPKSVKAWQEGTPMNMVLGRFPRNPWGMLTGSIQIEGSTLDDIKAELVDLKGRPLHRFLNARVAADGTFRIHSIAPAVYMLRISIGDRIVDIPNVKIDAGPNELSLSL